MTSGTSVTSGCNMDIPMYTENQIRQLIVEYCKEGMALGDILESQIGQSHLANEFVRIYNEMYGVQKMRRNIITSGRNKPMIFACNNGYIELNTCKFVPIKTIDERLLSSHVNFPLIYNYTDSGVKQNEIELNMFLGQLFPDPNILDYVLNLYAEKLDGVRRRDEFILHVGPSHSGKSCFKRLLIATFGDYCDTTIFGPHIVAYRDTNKTKNARINTFIPASSSINIYDELSNRIEDILIVKRKRVYFKFIDDLDTYMPDIELQHWDTTQITDRINRYIRIINYNSRFIDDYKLTPEINPETTPGTSAHKIYYFPKNNDMCIKIKQWAPFFLKMLFERYKVLKSHDFKQLEKPRDPSAY